MNRVLHRISCAVLIFLVAANETKSAEIVNEKGYTQQQWEDCGEKVIHEDLEKAVAKGEIPSIENYGGYYGTSGLRKWFIIIEKCGGKPTDGKLNNDEIKVLQKACKEATFDSLSTADRSYFWYYSETSPLIKNARAMCDNIPASYPKKEKISDKPWRLARLTSSSENSVRILIETDRNRKMKCAVYNSMGEPLAVDTTKITAPIDDMLILVPDGSNAVHSAKCWEVF